MTAADIAELKRHYQDALTLLNYQRTEMQKWATNNHIPQNIIDKANSYFNEVNEFFTSDQQITDKLDVRDGLSLPAAAYKIAYENTHDMTEKVLRDCNKKLEKNPRLYEYVAMPDDAIYAANTGSFLQRARNNANNNHAPAL